MKTLTINEINMIAGGVSEGEIKPGNINMYLENIPFNQYAFIADTAAALNAGTLDSNQFVAQLNALGIDPSKYTANFNYYS